MKFKHLFVAGAFDHLHQGHQALLSLAAKSSLKISCALSTRDFVSQKPLFPLIQPFSSRKSRLKKFFRRHSANFSLFPLNDSLEPAASSPQFDAIAASIKTAPRVELINRLRRLRHLPPLKSLIVDLVSCTDRKILSSTRIRQGQINRQGFVFRQIFRQQLTLPPQSRRFFREPFGKIVSTVRKKPKFFTITVGDIATISLLQQHIKPDLAVVDLQSKRQKIFNNLEELGLKPGLTAFNPPATITQDLVKKLLMCFEKSKITLLVKGEEDLAVLPAVLLSPLKTTIFYGQPTMGLVSVKVTEKTKAIALKLLSHFT